MVPLRSALAVGYVSSTLAADNPPAFLEKSQTPKKPIMASLETTVGYVAVNFTVAHLRLEPVNASSRWDGSPAAEGAELEEQQRLIGEQAYRDFSTTIQVFILLTSLLCKSNTHQRPQNRADLFCKRSVVRKYKRKGDYLSSLFTY